MEVAQALNHEFEIDFSLRDLWIKYGMFKSLQH